jgi:hypothetical protein
VHVVYIDLWLTVKSKFLQYSEYNEDALGEVALTHSLREENFNAYFLAKLGLTSNDKLII